KMYCISIGEIGHKPALVHPVIKYWHLTASFRAKLPALVAILYSDCQSGFCCCQCRTRDTDTPAYQCPEHSKESAIVTGYRAFKFTFVIDLGKFVKHIFIRDNNIVKINYAIIYTIEPHFVAAVFNGNP